MRVDSAEYQAWHEVGHAVVCLELGGDVYCVEFLEDHEVGQARARCVTNQDIRRHVACGGFAAELMLLRNGDLGQQDERTITQTLFRNATIDREMFFSLQAGSELTEEQDREFMDFSIDKVLPIVRARKSKMRLAVDELQRDGQINGERLKEILSET